MRWCICGCSSAVIVTLMMTVTTFAQQSAPPAKPVQPAAAQNNTVPLFFTEEWKQPSTPGDDHGAWPIAPTAVSNPNLELKLYGATSKEIQLSGVLHSPTNPLNLWTGMTTSPVAAALREKNNYVNLMGRAKIRWVTRTSGFHDVHPIIKLADGTWLAGDRSSGTWADFNQSEVSFSELRWIKLDIDRVVTTGRWVEKVDLAKIDEVGFADLLPGSGHGPGGWVNVGRIDVYGQPVKR
jgi:hypothetical protein